VNGSDANPVSNLESIDSAGGVVFSIATPFTAMMPDYSGCFIAGLNPTSLQPMVKKIGPTGALLATYNSPGVAGKTLTVVGVQSFVSEYTSQFGSVVLQSKDTATNKLDVGVMPFRQDSELASFTVPASIVGGNPCPVTIHLTGPSPNGVSGQVFSDTNRFLNVESQAANAYVAAGQSQASFNAFTGGVDATKVAHWTLELDGRRIDGSITILRASIVSVDMSPSPVKGGSAILVTVHFDGQIGPAGTALTVSSNKPGVIPNVTANVSGYVSPSTQAVVTTNAVAANTVVTLTFHLTGQAGITKTITVTP